MHHACGFTAPSSAPSITMDTTEQPERPAPGLRCGWAGCPVELPNEKEWIIHVSVHVFALKPGEPQPWLGPPELDPSRRRVDGMFFREFHVIHR